METVLIAYDVETMAREPQYPGARLVRRFFGSEAAVSTIARSFLRNVIRLHTETATPATLFVSGVTVEENPDIVREVRDCELLELASHGYSHKAFKTVQEDFDGKPGFRMEGAPVEEIAFEIESGRRALERVGVAAAGLTAPYSYKGGLLDRPEVRQMLLAAGFRYVRSWGRDGNDCSPLSFEVQPFFYDDGLLEAPICSWFDVNWRGANDGWRAENGFNNQAFRQMIEDSLQEVVRRDAVWSTGFHDWSMAAADPDLSSVEHLIRRARELGVNFMLHREFLEWMAEMRPDARAEAAGAS